MIHIAHLYPYELDLYGENGNLKALTYFLDEKNIKYKIDNIDIEDKINFNEYDFVYIGSGRKSFLDLVSKRLEPYKNDILKYIDNNKAFLVTGNAVSIFGNLGLYEVEYQETRKISNVIATTSLCKGLIKGFQNTEYLIKSTDSLIFQLEKGYGNNNTMLEGYKKNNFYATSIIGPILARNDNLCQYFIDILVKND